MKRQAFLMGLLLLSLSSVFLNSSALAATYYVATSGSDSNPGTESYPWRTIQKAANIMLPGDTVLIRQGIYQEKVIPMVSGTEGNYITYRNYGSETVVIDAQNGIRDSCIRVDGKMYLQFMGLRLTGASGPSDLKAGFYASDQSGYLLLDNITADNSRFGILVHGKYAPVSHVTISNCTVSNNTGHGIFLYRRVYDSVVGPNNHVFSNAGESDTYGIDITTNYPGVQSDGARNISVFDNEIDHNGVQGIRTWNAMNVLIRHNYVHHNGATGIQLEDGSENIIVDDNRCEYNAQTWEYETGIWVDDTKNAAVRGNVLRGNKIGFTVSASNHVIFRNNVVVENNRGVPNLNSARGINIKANSLDVMAVHNSLYRNGASESTKAGISIDAQTSVVCKNNILSETTAPYDLWVDQDYFSDYNAAFNTRPFVVEWKGSRISWTEYLAASKQDSHSVAANPDFVAPETGDYHLKSASPCIDSGGFMTKTNNSGNGRVVGVEDARYFTDGFGIGPGDFIKVGANGIAGVTNVDYAANSITLDTDVAWNKGDAVGFAYSGSAPDMGAFEFDGSPELPPNPPTGLKVIYTKPALPH